MGPWWDLIPRSSESAQGAIQGAKAGGGGGHWGRKGEVQWVGAWLPVSISTWIWILYEPFFGKKLKTTDLF